MNKMLHALAFLFLVALWLDASPGSAAAVLWNQIPSNLRGSGFQSVKSRLITVVMKIQSARLVLSQQL